MIKIAVFYEDNQVSEIEQTQEKDITIGRANGCTVHLDEPSVSRLHAIIRPQAGRWILERKANFGAVLLNGQEIENAPLEGGEELSIGKFILRINIESSKLSHVPSSRTSSVNIEDDDGRTKFVSSSAGGLFRFEPGTANVSEFRLEKDLALFGRGSNCDVILTEKKSSRKHFEVRRQGLSFFLKDLGSANGTLVNGKRIEGEVELVPGDVIAVGESKIEFSIEDQGFFKSQDSFLPVPSHLQEPAVLAEPGGYAPGVDPAAFGGVVSADTSGQAPVDEPPISSTDFIGRAKRAWFSIPKPQRIRYLTILIIGSLILAILGDPDDGSSGKKVVKPGSTKSRTYAALTPKQQKAIAAKYRELVDATSKKNFPLMKSLAEGILLYVDDYNDTKLMEAQAIRGMELQEEEKRQKKIAEEKEKLRQEVKALEEKGALVFEKALNESKYRPELQAVSQDILVKDPNNSLVKTWADRIRQKDEEEKRIAEEKQKREELRQKAEDALAAVRATFENGKYLDAIAEADKLSEVGWDDADYVARGEALKNEIRSKLSSIIDPLLKEASNQRGDGGDLVKARDSYNEVLKTDPTNREALEGLEAIYEVLHQRAKRFYAEAILAESLSDLTEAKDRFEKCLRSAPEKSIYRKRCRGKLARFDSFGNLPGGGGTGF